MGRGTLLSLAGASIAVLAPFVALGLFAQPSADDYVFAVRARELGFCPSQAFWYQSWFGRYTSTAVQTAFPLAFDLPAGYALVPLTLFPALAASLWWAVRATSRAMGRRLSRREGLVATAAVLALYVAQMPSVCEAFYWLSGAATYQVALVLLLALWAVLLSIPAKASPARIAAASALAGVLALATAGCNETMIPLLGAILLGGLVVSHRMRHASHVAWCVALAAAVAGGTFVVTAPGNLCRAACFPDRPEALEAAALAVWGTLRHAAKWAVHPVLLGATVLMAPPAVRAARGLPWAWRPGPRHVGAAGAAVVAILLAAFLPTYLGTGTKPPPRALDVLYFFFAAGWMATLFVAAAAYAARTPRPLVWSRSTVRWAQAAVAVGLLAVSNLPRATYDLAFLAPSYHRELEDRYAALERQARQGLAVVEIAPLETRPRSLHFAEVGEDPAQNEFYARYFGASDVAVRASPSRR